MVVSSFFKVMIPRVLLMANIAAGESHSALILLYRAIELPTAEEVKD